MGMYTEIFINVDLKEETPENIITTLKAICDRDASAPELQEHPSRWPWLFNNGSYYTPFTSCANLTHDKISNQWSLLGKGDIKNYENEIEAFFEWIMPWIDAEPGAFIGYHRYEEAPLPTLVLKEGE